MNFSWKFFTRNTASIAAFAAAFGLLIFLILPGWPIAVNDDFAYLRSIIETVQHGRPWTDNFLEPWAYSCSGISALIFLATGRMSLATVGVQVVAAAVSASLMCLALKRCGYRTFAYLGISGLLLSFPTLLWKQLEFTAEVVYIPALIGMLLCAVWRSPNLFYLPWAIALASRQGAVVLLCVPVLLEFEFYLESRKPLRLFGALAMACGGLGYFCMLGRLANVTHAQRFITSHVFSSVVLATTEKNILVALWVCLIGMGCGSAVRFAFGPRPVPRSAFGVFRTLSISTGVCLIWSIRYVANEIPLSFEHPFFENDWAAAYLRCITLIGALGFVVAPPILSIPRLVGAVASLCLASLRSEVWDYYLIDAALFAFFAVQGHVGECPNVIAERPFSLVTVGRVLSLVVPLALQLYFTGPVKQLLDHRAGADVVLERALRARWMTPVELSSGPFGFSAWHLLPYYLSHEGKGSGDLGGFGMYVSDSSVDVRIDGVSRREAEAAKNQNRPDPRYQFGAILPRGWFGYARFYVVRPESPKPPRAALQMGDYHFVIFPLDDREWRELSRSEALDEMH